MDGERGQVLGQAGRRGGVLPLERADEGAQAGLGLGGGGGPIERGPVGRPDALMEVVTLGQLGEDVAEAMDGAALAVGLGPQLADRAHQTRGPIGDDEERIGQAPRHEPAAEVEPVLEPLAHPEADIEQHPLAGEA